MGRKPQSVPELSSAVEYAAQLKTANSWCVLVVLPEPGDASHVYAGAELVVRCRDGGLFTLRRSTERVSTRSDVQMVGAQFRAAMRLWAAFEATNDADRVRLAEWDRGAAQLRSARA